VYCFDAGSGQLLWQTPIPKAPPRPHVRGAEEREREETGLEEHRVEYFEGDTSYAASTPAVDGMHVAVAFSTGELACLDFQGKVLWTRALDVARNHYGYANSLLLWRDRLIVQADQGDADDGRSALLALDLATGQEVWRTARPVGGSWASPLLIGAAGHEQVVTAADPYVMAHDPQSGAELWRIKCLNEDTAPSPIFEGGLILAVRSRDGDSEVLALRPDGMGDVTDSNIVWRCPGEAPDIPSPAAAGGLVFLLRANGTLTCRDLKTGAQVWSHDFEGCQFRSSPAVVGDKLYLLSQQGVLIVVAVGRDFHELGRCDLGEGCDASPAFAPGRMYVRTRQHLYALGAAGGGGR